MKYYAGIGSRNVSEPIGLVMVELAKILNKKGYVLRSGCAEGSDQWFQKGVGENKEAQIWLPWSDFNKDFQKRFPNHDYRTLSSTDTDAIASIRNFHPRRRLGYHTKLFMARNYRQVIGLNEPDSEFIICWTLEGNEVGGTSQAIRIANHYKIPVFNLFNWDADDILKEIEKINILQ